MAVTSKAPAGGMTSAVNGQRYEGGEFMPDHGKFCGRGRNRVSMARFVEVAAIVAAAGKVLIFEESTGDFRVMYPSGNGMFRARNLETLAKCF